ncbi:hypothetical protein [Butyrivibrio sp.]|uniref:hypothetical protein n=1 Tax=Butyrivibrio sp. TaxID=28121 RepID=UPI0025C07258|nr:hypothetical protein [Butyrivibrio sp.]MBQ7430260.1 hypothetical protein [Butyrivibrio sp.]MBQ9303434.1 hypothetical protein [Butyrivibrio sp.]
MSMNTIIIILVALWGGIGLIVGFLMLNKKRRAKKALNQGHLQIVAASNKKSSVFFLYWLYRNLPVLKKDYNYLESKVRILYPADELSIRLQATKIMSKALGKAGIIAGLAVLFGSVGNFIFAGEMNFYFMFLGVLLAWRTYKRTTKLKLDEAEHRLLKQYSDFLFNNLVPAYQKFYGRLDDALFFCIDSLPTMMALHATRIYDVVKSPHLAEAAAEYTEYAPNNYFSSLVSLIVPTKIYGDKTLEDGKTTFIKGVMNLNVQLNEELLMRQRLDAAFASLSNIVLMGVGAMMPLYWFFISFLPQTKSFFSSGLGTTAETIIFLTTLLCDYLLDSLKSTAKAEVVEDSIWKKIADHPRIQPLLNIQYAKHYTFMNRVDKQMRAIGNHTGVKAKMVECAAFALGAFIAVNLIFMTSMVQQSRQALNDFANDFTNVITPSDEYNAQMEYISKTLSKQYRKEMLTEADKDRVITDIRSQDTAIKAESYVTPTAEAIISHNQEYHNVYFRFWYEFIALLAAIITFNVPLFLLNYRAKAAEMGKEDEVNSFNLLATIFMEMDGIQVETLLEWMERFSYYFREAVVECIITYPVGRFKALEKLRDYDEMPTFQRFIESMINVDKVGMKQAFADIEIQKEFYNEKRKADNEVLINRKKHRASTVAFIPFYVTCAVWLGAPIALYAYQLIQQFMTQLGALM